MFTTPYTVTLPKNQNLEKQQYLDSNGVLVYRRNYDFRALVPSNPSYKKSYTPAVDAGFLSRYPMVLPGNMIANPWMPQFLKDMRNKSMVPPSSYVFPQLKQLHSQENLFVATVEWLRGASVSTLALALKHLSMQFPLLFVHLMYGVSGELNIDVLLVTFFDIIRYIHCVGNQRVSADHEGMWDGICDKDSVDDELLEKWFVETMLSDDNLISNFSRRRNWREWTAEEVEEVMTRLRRSFWPEEWVMCAFTNRIPTKEEEGEQYWVYEEYFEIALNLLDKHGARLQR